jgi:hypothetical protein
MASTTETWSVSMSTLVWSCRENYPGFSMYMKKGRFLFGLLPAVATSQEVKTEVLQYNYAKGALSLPVDSPSGAYLFFLSIIYFICVARMHTCCRHA